MDTFCAEFYYMSLSCIKSGFAQVSFKDHAPVCGTMYSAWVMLRLGDWKEQCQRQKTIDLRLQMNDKAPKTLKHANVNQQIAIYRYNVLLRCIS